MKTFRASDAEKLIRDLQYREYDLPMFHTFVPMAGDGKSRFFDFKDGMVVPTKIYLDWVDKIKNKLVKGGVDYTITSVKLKIGSISGNYPQIDVKYKDVGTGEEENTYLGCRQQYGRNDSVNSGFMIQFDHWTFCQRVADWCVKNDYRSNIAKSAVIQSWNNKNSSTHVPFNWITYLTNVMGITNKVLIGNKNMFACSPETLAVKNEELNKIYIDWEPKNDNQTKGIDFPYALRRFYFSSLKELYDEHGNKYEVDNTQVDYDGRYQEQGYKFYCINNLCDIIDGEMILHKEKYDVMTAHWENQFKSMVKENAGRYELMNYALQMQKWNDGGSHINTNMFVGVPDVKGLCINFSGTSKRDEATQSYRGRDAQSETWVLTMAKRLGVYEDLVKGIRNIITRNMGNNMLEALIDERRPWFYDVYGMESFDLIGLIGDILKEEV